MKVNNWPTIVVPTGWNTLADGFPRDVLEQVALPRYLASQRWFGAKSLGLEMLQIRDLLPILEEPSPAFLVLVETHARDGSHDLYDIPMAIVTGAKAKALVKSNPHSVIAALNSPDGEGILFDAGVSDDFCKALFHLIVRRSAAGEEPASLQSLQTNAIAETTDDCLEPIARGSEEQSNTTVVFNQRYLLKIFRKLETGLNPDFEIGRFLTEKTTFHRSPNVFGALQCQTKSGIFATIALLQDFVPHSTQAWEWMLGVLDRYLKTTQVQTRSLDPAVSRGSFDPVAMIENELSSLQLECLGPSLQAAALLGQRTAELHLALASRRDDSAFAPETLAPDEYRARLSTLDKEARAAFNSLREKAATRDPELHALVDQILQVGPRIVAEVLEAPVNPEPMIKIRCHGDYHLGQVLRVGDDFMILDFEGEPGRSIEERRAEQSPWKDVAGMLRSFDYAAASASLKLADHDELVLAALEPWAREWSASMSAAFLKSYRQTAAAGGLMLGETQTASRLLRRFMVEKLIFEVRYESNYRPSWLRIPLLGLSRLSGPQNPSGFD